MVSVIESLGAMCSPIYSLVYSATVHSWDGFAMLTISATGALSLACLCMVMPEQGCAVQEPVVGDVLREDR